ncbi:MAG: hypothetical protein KJP23_31875 [Deltaproteobacteria bacterium]|nr:hypothetical protein [Deltaproteobacteria bacterium]
MNGSVKLSSEEKYEMLTDARNLFRGRVFYAAKMSTQASSLDDYIDFLSENMEWANVVASKRITSNFKL